MIASKVTVVGLGFEGRRIAANLFSQRFQDAGQTGSLGRQETALRSIGQAVADGIAPSGLPVTLGKQRRQFAVKLISTIAASLAVLLLSNAPAVVRAAEGKSVLDGDQLSETVRAESVETLRSGLNDAEGWTKVHAAEFLLELSYPQKVRDVFEVERSRHGDESPYRIGIWRVLAQASRTEAERQSYVDRLLAAALDRDGPDRLHAIESLAKLGESLEPADAEAISSWAAEVPAEQSPFVIWLLSLSGAALPNGVVPERQLVDDLTGEPLTRLRAAVALVELAERSDEADFALIKAGNKAASGKSASGLPRLADAYVIASAWKVASANPDSLTKAGSDLSTMETVYRRVLKAWSAEANDIAMVFANTLAGQGKTEDAAWLAERLHNGDAEVRLSAAHALLRLDRRRASAMTSLDWTIIAAYFAMMLGIGVFYAGRTKDSDDFLLGGRHMKSWMVGLSLFATLLSTLTYLAVPGEMIRHGPVIVMGLASLPLVAWIVGWLLIPAFMRLEVTSAYEILETRFGYGGRLFGSLMFLLLRFFWMAVILYATTDAVIVPLLGWSSDATPWICAVLGIITVVYSSLGGLRAVVLTDVIQTGILLGGALFAVGVITVQLGVVATWWPTQWDPTWAPLRFFDARSPRTVLMAVLATGLWYICTAGSDQMAIQRYLATRDIKSARKMFHITLLMNVASWFLLTTLGFALLGFYRSHPEFLADGTTVAADADKLFPRFIAVGLPVGISGLVVAGLLAAAMSSLSSGINSSCAVISIDYVGRLRKGKPNAKPGLKQTQIISWGIGGVAVLLSMAAGFVPGNLLDVVYRIGNLLVAPLFVLFFLALFIERATWKATCAGVSISIVVAVVVAYGTLIGQGLVAIHPSASPLAERIERFAALGVLWIMPLSLVTGITVGWLGSLLGFGTPAPPLRSTEA